MFSVRRPRALPLAALLLAGVCAGAGCGKKIGDDCTLNTDCDPQGGRICDIAQPGGYCTIEGCDLVNNTCPGEATCIRFFPTLDMTKPCSPELEAACTNLTPGCNPDTDPTCCRCTADEECITEGFCLRRDLEFRACMKTCGSDSDCRGDYLCYATGVGGAERVPLEDGTPQPTAHFCAPAP